MSSGICHTTISSQKNVAIRICQYIQYPYAGPWKGKEYNYTTLPYMPIVSGFSSGFDPEIADKVLYFMKIATKLKHFGEHKWENLQKLAKL